MVDRGWDGDRKWIQLGTGDLFGVIEVFSDWTMVMFA